MFKTLGAKRYMYEQNGKIHITIAGLSKQNGVDYMAKVCNNDHKKMFDMFADDEIFDEKFNDNAPLTALTIPADYTGKNTHTYIDSELQADITDYTGITEHVISKSAVHLEKCEFTLSISKKYAKFIQNLRNGYFFRGTKKL